MTMSSGILQAYLIDALTTKGRLRHEELLKRHQDALLDHELYSDDGGFLTSLSFYSAILDRTDEVLFRYMSSVEKDQLCYELQVTYLLLLTQKEYELRHQKTENKGDYNNKITRCEALLDALNPQWQAIIEKAPEQNYSTDGKPVKYLGIPLAKEFAEKLNEFIDSGKSKTIRSYLGALNEKRLYWVWGSSFLKTMLSLVPDTFYNARQAGDVVRTPDLYTGTLSWGLYYFRFSLNFFLLLKHTVAHPWMSDDEAAIPWYERFQSQWTQRKFTLLNDSLWATANLLCFFWLNGGGVMGAAGDALTIALLLFDVSVAVWDFAEQQAVHKAQLAQYDADLKALNAKRDLILGHDETSELQKSQLAMQIRTLERAQKECIKNWELQKLGLCNNLAYAVGLMLAFVVLAMPFAPISAATALTLSVVGAVLCFTFTVINNAIRGGIELYKTHNAINDNEEVFVEKLRLLQSILKEHPQLGDNQKKLLFLEIKKFDAQTEHQRQMAVLQSMHLIRSIMLEAFIPAVIFSCLVFFPLSIGLGALGGALGLAIASNLLINALCTPNNELLTVQPFDPKEYAAFCALAQDEHKSTKDYHAFFKRKENALVKTITVATAADNKVPERSDEEPPQDDLVTAGRPSN